MKYVLVLLGIVSFLALSSYTLALKIFISIIMSVIIILLFFFRKKNNKVKYFIVGLPLGLCFLLNIWHECRYGILYKYQYGNAYNSTLKWAGTQLVYSFYSDTLLPLLLQGKKVYFQDGVYNQYVSYWADNSQKINVPDSFSYDMCQKINLGSGMDIASTNPCLFKEKDAEKIHKWSEEHNPCLFVYASSKNIACEEVMVLVTDQEYNIYLLTETDYKKISGEDI